ncbi:MAG: Rpn family recombination-promoting nuclease/putative transposase, partial [[Clostridium] scindens]
PKVDFCFKELMEEPEVRRGFISAVLGIRPEEIIQTTLLPTHLRKESQEEKLGILDVRVLLNGDIQINMEMQVAPFELWAERSLFYLGKMYIDQIKEGEDYDVLKKCIHIGILDFVMFQEDEEFYSRFHIWEDQRHRKYTDKLEVHILELPKLDRYRYPQTELLKWARFINAERKEDLEMIAKTDKFLGKAYEALTNLSADEKKRLEYEAREKAIRDHHHQMKSNWNAGHEQGLKQGIEQGEKSGEERMARLAQQLIRSERLEELERAVEDQEYRMLLFEEFHI